MTKKSLRPETLAIRGFKEQTEYNEHNQALFLTSSFTYSDSASAEALFLGKTAGYTYTRTANPTVSTFAKRMALLEEAEAAQATATGMAAIQVALLSFLKSGDHLIASKSLFGTTVALIDSFKDLGVEISYVSQTDEQEWQKAVKSNTKLFFLETPSNPLTEVADLQALSEIAHKAGALLVVDNTFCSPVLQKPLVWGADLSIESATKLIDGQGRVSGGTVAGKKELVEKVSVQVKTAGQALSPFNAWILLSGIETLHVRVRQQSANTQALAEWLQEQKAVEHVFYPGLKDHPQYHLAQKQQESGGIVLSFTIKGGRQQAWKLVDSLKLFSTTGNLGDVRSIITHPFTTTHVRLAPETKIAAGITDNLLRISVGLENIEDLKDDLAQGFDLI